MVGRTITEHTDYGKRVPLVLKCNKKGILSKNKELLSEIVLIEIDEKGTSGIG